jgi:tetrahydromethanopterin S-methyltransferase subunit C
MLSKVMAGCLALAGFAVAILAGLAAGNSAGDVLVRALIAMLACYPVGFVVGMICERVIAMHIEQNHDAQASDSSGASDGDRSAEASGDEEVLTV